MICNILIYAARRDGGDRQRAGKAITHNLFLLVFHMIQVLIFRVGWAKCDPRNHFVRPAGTYRNINFYRESSRRPLFFSSALNVNEKQDICGRVDLFFCSSDLCRPSCDQYIYIAHPCYRAKLTNFNFQKFHVRAKHKTDESVVEVE